MKPQIDERSGPSPAERFMLLSSEERKRRFDLLTPEEQARLKYNWKFWARPNQSLPSGTWNTWIAKAGRGWGKTRVGAEAVREWARSDTLVNIIAPTTDSARDVCIEGESGVMAICPNEERPKYAPSRRRLEWPNGGFSYIYTADEPERLRGPQHKKLWCLVGETQVLMANGTQKEIKHVREGDFVQTRQGPRAVLAQALTKRNAELFSLETVDGRVIIGTGDHPVFVDGVGFLPLEHLRPGMKVCAMLASNGTVNVGTDRPMATTKRPLGYTAKCGEKRKGRFRRALKFITSTKLNPTIASRTSSFFLTANIAPDTQRASPKRGRKRFAWHSRRACKTGSPVSCASCDVSYVVAFIAVAQNILAAFAHPRASKRLALESSPETDGFANIAVLDTWRRSACNAIVPENVINVQPRIARHRSWSARFNARTARILSRAADPMRGFAEEHAPLLSTATIASVAKLAKRANVYDLAVQNAREFFANGILVHNCDELAAWRYLDDAWTNAMFGLRLGSKPQALVTTTPKPLKILKELLQESTTIITNGTTYENKANLAQKFYGEIIKKYEGTRLGRQEIHAELLDDNPGALWRLSWFDDLRVDKELFWATIYPNLLRIVGAIDPAATANEDSDETGIGFMGVMTWDNVKKCLPQKLLDLCKDEAGQYREFEHYFFFDDRSDKYSPDGWGKAACSGYHQFNADRIIGETNNGGDMVEATLRNVDPNVSYKGIHASRGKQTRAEPVAALYEQRRAHHVGTFGTLEDQCCDYDPRTAQYSPDRMDMLVWGMTELSASSTVLGLLDYDSSGSAMKQMDSMAKVKAATDVAKPVVSEETLKCPKCGCLVVQTIAGGQNRCMQCAWQWGGKEKAAPVPGRGDYLAKGR